MNIQGENLKKIMIVDDEPDQIFTIKTVLENEKENFEVISANSGMECIQKLNENVNPELIILDIMMPEMSGWEVLKIIRENQEWKNIPVLFLTARTDETAENAGRFLADDFIKKPFDISELLKSIDKILKKYY